MAKQTFTTGQVLTAAQMTSLQQTAMLGGAASAKVASYTLVAADAGTAISMSNASATTITVNTGLFAAGDTVFIQNIGAGACTVTAGTATVATAGSLILPQNDAGILYFTATGAATFYDFIQAGAVSPLTTKGDVYTFSTSDARLAVGANGTVLTANSAQATGLEFATPTSGGMTLLSTTTLSGASTTITVSSTGYNRLMIDVTGVSNATADGELFIKPNNQDTLGFATGVKNLVNTKSFYNFRGDSIYLSGGSNLDRADVDNRWTIFIDYPAAVYHPIIVYGKAIVGANNFEINAMGATMNNAITSLVFVQSGGSFSTGTVRVFGVK